MGVLRKTLHISLFIFITSLTLSFYSCSEKEDPDVTEKIPDNGFKDARDGQIYTYVKIGDQTWLAENLRYKTNTGSWYYNDNSSDVKKYGMLYTFSAAKSACPEGWHLPTDEEWKQLEMYLGMSQKDADKEGYRGTNEANQLKESGTLGFDVMFAGMRGITGEYLGRGTTAEFWTSTKQFEGNTSWSREIHDITPEIGREANQIGSGLSVRCVKD